MDSIRCESELTGLSRETQIPKWDAALYETPEAPAPDLETPEQKSLINIAIALRGIESQLTQLNKILRKK